METQKKNKTCSRSHCSGFALRGSACRFIWLQILFSFQYTHTHTHTQTLLPRLLPWMQRGKEILRAFRLHFLSSGSFVPSPNPRLRPHCATKRGSCAAKKAFEKPHPRPSFPPRAFEVSLSSARYLLRLQIPDSIPTWSPGLPPWFGADPRYACLVFHGASFLSSLN